MHISAPAVQGWLQATKLRVDEVDAELEVAAANIVFGRLGSLYTTTTWIDEASTPAIVKTIMSMLVAAWTYRRAYAEVIDTDQNYADWLESQAYALIDLILGGTIDIDGGVLVDETGLTGKAWPDNTTGSSQQFDARGLPVGDSAYSEDIKFRMGSRF